jgi:hypothetical protein
MRFAQILHSLCTPSTSIAFLCCPTAFVAFQHTKALKNAKLLEIDGRFGVLAPRHYVPYDMEEPTTLPASLTGAVDIAVVDPPFLNEVCSLFFLFFYFLPSGRRLTAPHSTRIRTS